MGGLAKEIFLDVVVEGPTSKIILDIIKKYKPFLEPYYNKGQVSGKDLTKIKVAIQEEVFNHPELLKDQQLTNKYKDLLFSTGVVGSRDGANSLMKRNKIYMSNQGKKNLKQAGANMMNFIRTNVPYLSKLSEKMKIIRKKSPLNQIKRIKTFRLAFMNRLKDIQAIKEEMGIDLGRAIDLYGKKVKSLKKQLISKKDDELVHMDSMLNDPDPEIRMLGHWWKNARKEFKEIYSAKAPKSLKTKLHTSASGPGLKETQYWKAYKEKTGSDWIPDDLEAEHVMMWPDKYKLAAQGKFDVAQRFRQPTYATTRARNIEKNNLVSQLKVRLNKKNKIVNDLQESIEAGSPNPTILEDLSTQTALIEDTSRKAKNLGLSIALPDSTGKIRYYGGRYDNFIQLVKSYAKGLVPTEEKLIGPPEALPQGKNFADGGLVSIEEMLGYNYG